MDNKDRYEDMTSLFLPDISHQNPRRPPNNSSPESSETARNDPSSKSDIDVPFPLDSRNNSQSNFTNFLNNNDFITWKLPNDFNGQMYPSGSTTPGGITNGNNATNSQNVPTTSSQTPSGGMDQGQGQGQGHLNHYSSYVPFEALPHHHHHNHSIPSQLFPSSNVQPQPFQKPMDGSWLPGYNGFDMDRGVDTKMNPALNYADLMDQNTMLIQQLQQQLQQQQQPMHMTPQGHPQQAQDAVAGLYGIDVNNFAADEDSLNLGEKKADRRKRNYKTKAKSKPKASSISIDYSTEKLTKLLDLKCKKLNLDYKLTDQKGNDISIDFQGFLNGRVLTNDLDNSTYIFSVLENRVTDKTLKNTVIKSDPKVMSCYRRNFIQVSLNFNLSGFRNYSPSEAKILKLQTSEYGYNMSRVVKWFKIEISAISNNASTGQIPLIIRNDIKDKERDRKEEIPGTIPTDPDTIFPQSISSSEQVVTINNATITDNKIENFFTVKKLQFKSATPNNGNLSFQNYYYLKIKLSAVVADLYFDDYIDDEFAATSTDSSRNEIQLFELESDPITVRGRNPSFYAERKDLLVKGRSVSSRKAYEQSSKTAGEDNFADQILSQINFDGDDGLEEGEADADAETRQDSSDHEQDNEYEDSEESEDKKKSTTGSPIMPVNFSPKKSIPPVIYNSNSSIDLDAMLKNIKSDGSENYKYFPISNVYYLPPVNVVYFPHGAHQHIEKIKNSSPAVEERVARRKSSNVYFK